ncbi:MAG TPA: LON peptidase substrate-binding domain-containing protein, partial [Isosphaeraceae bacterium]|nr:LON peptidase substrate-binding domain-containing protein [Isosphaeraceae bacterium]
MIDAKPEPLDSLPVLPLKNSVLFPHLFLPLSIGRPVSLAAAEAVLATEDKTFLALALKNPQEDPPAADDLYTIGTKAVIKKMARSGAGIELLVQGLERVTLVRLEQTEPYLRAKVRPLPLPEDQGTEVEALRRAVLDLTARALELAHPEGGVNIDQLAAQATDPLILVFLIGSMLSLDVPREQALLETTSRAEGLRMLHGYLTHELQILELRQKISSQAQNEMGREQKEYLLRQQLRAIQGELGETTPEKADVQELRNRLLDADLPEDVHKEFERELGRMERLPAAAPDYQITRTYLEFVLELPWRKSTEDDLDLNRAQQVLDEDHFDLEKIKERIIEHLAV